MKRILCVALGLLILSVGMANAGGLYPAGELVTGSTTGTDVAGDASWTRDGSTSYELPPCVGGQPFPGALLNAWLTYGGVTTVNIFLPSATLVEEVRLYGRGKHYNGGICDVEIVAMTLSGDVTIYGPTTWLANNPQYCTATEVCDVTDTIAMGLKVILTSPAYMSLAEVEIYGQSMASPESEKLDAIEAKLDAGGGGGGGTIDLTEVLDAIAVLEAKVDAGDVDLTPVLNAIAALATKVDALEAKLDIIDDLLRTPQGRRDGWNE